MTTPPLASPCLLSAALDSGFACKLVGTYADLRDHIIASAGGDQLATLSDHAQWVCDFGRATLDRIERLHEASALFNARFASALDEPAERLAIMDFAQRLGADEAQLKRDRKALDTFFDRDAVFERYRRRAGECERALAYATERLGYIVGGALKLGEIGGESALLVRTIAPYLASIRAYRGDSRVRQAAHRALRRIGESAPEPLHGFWVDTAVRDTRRLALDASEDTWAQCDAFATLLAMSPQSLEPVLEKRLEATSDRGSALRQDNRMFVRRYIADLLCRAAGANPPLAKFLPRIANDRNGAVRQALAASLPHLPKALAVSLVSRLRVDRDPQVRAMLFFDAEGMASLLGAELYRSHIVRVLDRDTDGFVLRLTIDAATRVAAWQVGNDPRDLPQTIAQLQTALVGLRHRAEPAEIRRWAGKALERLWLLSDADALDLAEYVTWQIAKTPEGGTCALPELGQALESDPVMVGRMMSVLAQDGFGLELVPGRVPKVQKGERFKRRLWRILFEFGTSATDKRQAFLHTIGRVLPGPISAPAAHLAELAPTKVLGEPLKIKDEGGWRNYLPLVDHALSALDRGGETRIFTSEGVTTLTACPGIVARAKAYWRMSRAYPRLSALRNAGTHEYVEALKPYGVTVRFAPHDYGEPLALPDREASEPAPIAQNSADREVVHLFGMGGALVMIPVLFESAAAYFATVFANTLGQLALFLLLAAGWFFGRHIYLARKARQYRGAIPLSLGGWGTRGKSGTERLKAGLMNALGHPLISKTTGCEAMFLRGEAFGDLTEMFLFRPYDKATIWEQLNLIRISAGLKARVFLWECMGLNPAYVRVLQQDWMRDDIGTITNTYPDHEDVQGPAGRNIPEVMCEFIPHRSVLLTTEEEMLPILAEGARRADTRLRTINWRQAGLVHANLLARFPYAEHPYNIALVAAMGDELGLSEDYSIKEMSDRVVADLGVLKIYPRAPVEGATLEFVMGMSANEKFGAMGNWDRMGFAHHDLSLDPEIYVTTLVNNRADRVPRSRVFARMLVQDVAADRHFIIGSNIDGMMGFIAEEWAAYANTLNIFDDEKRSPAEKFEALGKHQRVPMAQDQLEGRLRAMLTGQLSAEAQDQAVKAAREMRLEVMLKENGVAEYERIAQHYAELSAQLESFLKLRTRLAQGGDQAALDREIKAFLRAAFMAKLVPVRDFYISGENIVRLIGKTTPPGLVNRIMGMQNIKGTGLDYVYRWQAWETVHRACVQAVDPHPVTAEKGLALLASFQEYGVLSAPMVRETIATLKASGELPSTFGPAQLDAIVARVDAQLAELDAGELSSDSGGGEKGRLAQVGDWLVEASEAVLDAGDAVRRRRRADGVYKAMIAEQISSGRAALELKKLTKRQKGGWLAASLADAGGSVTALLPRALWRKDA
ncbi:hypothetical protein [Qipengyuania atrilutea]|uniref:Capsule biosynthesis protein CapB n=1 Tax=Qipengyuania atrilutea TaxID=2744473 RepID=A0A850H184_9SPHN|nr:hypothetical protein [Actirhodobacter atriluteus]NVD44446.1 hypothetical protein [Actirhodobacter atriluteus]